MKFFIDTANLNEIKEANDMGVLDGVTTNPSLCAKEGIKDFDAFIGEVCEIVQGPVSAEVVSTDFDGMMKEAHRLAKISEHVVIKVPLIADGIKTIKQLTDEGIKTNCTLCFSPSQALVAAKAGATYISPFVGRLDDISHDGMDLISQIVQIYENYDLDTEVLVASVRHTMHLVDSALMGAHVATMPFSVIAKLISHPLTDAGLEQFLKDWDKLQKS
ncbi:fructose-6-phosphate aldolase [Balneolaceae bacterium ANBcel3]|nr:fructose-6-phosphate aldolase [Balneolaceae bacterium ANBcel3]